jgi:hypothetical protein
MAYVSSKWDQYGEGCSMSSMVLWICLIIVVVVGLLLLLSVVHIG